MKNLSYYLTCSLMLLLSLSFLACDKNEENTDENNTNPKNIIGKWQKSQVLDEDNSWVPGDLDEFWIFKSDGSFQNEDNGAITSVGTYKINGNILTINSHSIDEPKEIENFSGEFYFRDDFMYYDYIDLETGDGSTVLFKRY